MKHAASISVNVTINDIDLDVFAEVTFDTHEDAFDYEYWGERSTCKQGLNVDPGSIEIFQINDVLLDGQEFNYEDNGIDHATLKDAVEVAIVPQDLLCSVV